VDSRSNVAMNDSEQARVQVEAQLKRMQVMQRSVCTCLFTEETTGALRVAF
jgi:hypothetical protein